jgi:hypothetical protein
MRPKLSDHEDDSYGACVICREYVPHTDDEFLGVRFPCPTVRLAAIEVAAPPAATPALDVLRAVADHHNGEDGHDMNDACWRNVYALFAGDKAEPREVDEPNGYGWLDSLSGGVNAWDKPKDVP